MQYMLLDYVNESGWPQLSGGSLSVGSSAAVGTRVPLSHGEANWTEVVQLYDALFAMVASPVVAINLALAIAELQGARAGLEVMPEAGSDSPLAEYQPYWAVRAELLARTGAHEEARDAVRKGNWSGARRLCATIPAAKAGSVGRD
jgi:hypothetical protein